MKNLKSFLLFFLGNLLILISDVKASSNYSETEYSPEQKELINYAFNHPEFLIGDQLINLNAKKYILTNLNQLQLNIYLSGLIYNSYQIQNTDFIIQYSSNGNRNLYLTNYYNIEAINFSYTGFYSSAIASFKKSLIAAYALKDFKKIGSISSNLTHLYLLKNDLLNVEKNNNICLENLNNSNNRYGLINCVILKAHLALLKGEFQKAENIILKNALLLSSQSRKSEQQCYFELGKIYLKNKRFTEAKWFFIQSFTLAEKLNLRLSKIKSLLLLAKAKNMIKDHSLALNDLLLVEKMSDNTTTAYQIDLQLELAQTYSYLNAKVKAKRSLSNLMALKNNYLSPKI
jgi:hypothetical protein